MFVDLGPDWFTMSLSLVIVSESEGVPINRWLECGPYLPGTHAVGVVYRSPFQPLKITLTNQDH
jgi:hypothetical protein